MPHCQKSCWVGSGVFSFVSGTYLGIPVTIVLRGCNNSIPVDVASMIPDTHWPTPEKCVHFTHNYLVKEFGVIVPVSVTVCPCTTQLCNAGSITLGGTAGTAPPPSTISPPSTSSHSSVPPVLTNPTVQSSSKGRRTTTQSGGSVSHANDSDSATSVTLSQTHNAGMTRNTQNYPGFLIATFLAAILGRHRID